MFASEPFVFLPLLQCQAKDARVHLLGCLWIDVLWLRSGRWVAEGVGVDRSARDRMLSCSRLKLRKSGVVPSGCLIQVIEEVTLASRRFCHLPAMGEWNVVSYDRRRVCCLSGEGVDWEGGRGGMGTDVMRSEGAAHTSIRTGLSGVAPGVWLPEEGVRQVPHPHGQRGRLSCRLAGVHHSAEEGLQLRLGVPADVHDLLPGRRRAAVRAHVAKVLVSQQIFKQPDRFPLSLSLFRSLSPCFSLYSCRTKKKEKKKKLEKSQPRKHSDRH